jgi:hypothetical protein
MSGGSRFLPACARAYFYQVKEIHRRSSKMQEHEYRDQLIRVIATQTPGTEYWVAKADVRYNDGKKLQFIPVQGPRDKFTTKEEAELNIIQQAKKLIDTRS